MILPLRPEPDEAAFGAVGAVEASPLEVWPVLELVDVVDLGAH